jgi:hypothetical protein
MSILYRMLVLVALTAMVTGCRAARTQVPTVEPSPTATPLPSATFTPAYTPTPKPTPSHTPIPTPAEVAPEATFTDVGAVAELESTQGVAGKAIVAGLQTLILQGFTFDGKGLRVDVRLVSGQDYANPVAILMELEPRVYTHELVLMRIPATAGPDTADGIALYAPETGEVYAAAKFD